MEVLGTTWDLLAWNTYIISVLARGTRGTAGTHGTLEETGRKVIRIARIREKIKKKKWEGRDWKEEVGKSPDDSGGGVLQWENPRICRGSVGLYRV